MSLRLNLAALIAACLLTRGALAQSSATTASPVGVWRGTSQCLVRPSSCNDEVVIYRITRGKTSDSLSIDAFRITNGQEVDMGALGCLLKTESAQITCAMPNGVWRFTVRADSLVGELRVADNTKFRDVRTVRSR